MDEKYNLPWIYDFLENQFAQGVEDYKYPEGHLLKEVTITASGRPEDKMRANLQSSIERRLLKDAKDAYTLLRNMNQALTNFAQNVGLPLMFMPAAPLATLGWSIGSPAFHGAALAIDKKVGGHTADNIVSGAELGLMGLGVGAGAYAGGRTLLNNTNLGRALLLSRAIGRGKVRETPNFGNNELFRATVYRGGPIKYPRQLWVSTDPKYVAQYGPVRKYLFETRNPSYAELPLMGARDPVSMDMMIYTHTRNNPQALAIIGHDLVTGEFPYLSEGLEILSLNPYLFRGFRPKSKYVYPWQQPSRSTLTEAERLGIPKSDRGNLNTSNPSGEILHRFYSLLDRLLALADARKKLLSSGDDVSTTILKNNREAHLDTDLGYIKGSSYITHPFVGEKSFRIPESNVSFGRQGVGGNGHNYGLNLGGVSTRVKDLGTNEDVLYGDINLDPWGNNHVITRLNIIDTKEGVKDLVQGMRDMKSGAEFSGDARFTTPAEALSTWLRIAKSKPLMRLTAIENARKVLKENSGIDLGEHVVNNPIRNIVTENATMSPDAYSFFMRTAKNNPNKFHIGYGAGNAGWFNSFARHPLNAPMYELELNYLQGLITPQEYIKGFNKWGEGLGLRKAYFYNGQLYKPLPYLIRNKQGGKMNIIEKFKKGNKIHIKKANRGKFTEYCGGKVTSECIARGKNSSDPAVRKRATFAANARKWKHREGGLIVQEFKLKRGGKAFVAGVSVLDSNPNIYKHEKKKKLKKAQLGSKIDWGTAASAMALLGTAGLNMYLLSKNATTAKEALKALKEAMIDSSVDDSNVDILTQNYIEHLKLIDPNINIGNITFKNIRNMFASQARSKAKNDAENWYKQLVLNIDLNLDLAVQLFGNSIGSSFGTLVSAFGLNKPNNSSVNAAPSSNFTTNISLYKNNSMFSPQNYSNPNYVNNFFNKS